MSIVPSFQDGPFDLLQSSLDLLDLLCPQEEIQDLLASPQLETLFLGFCEVNEAVNRLGDSRLEPSQGFRYYLLPCPFQLVLERIITEPMVKGELGYSRLLAAFLKASRPYQVGYGLPLLPGENRLFLQTVRFGFIRFVSLFFHVSSQEGLSDRLLRCCFHLEFGVGESLIPSGTRSE